MLTLFLAPIFPALEQMLFHPVKDKTWGKGEKRKTHNSSVGLCKGLKPKWKNKRVNSLHWCIEYIKSFNLMYGLNIFDSKTRSMVIYN